MSLIRVQSGCLAFGHVPLLDQVELDISVSERVCLVGRNGTGKSTLLNVLTGEQILDSGQLWKAEVLKISKLAQEVPDAMDATLFEVVSAGLGDHSELLARYHNESLRLTDGGEAALLAFSRLQAEVEHAGAWEGSERIDATLSRLALPPDVKMSTCSGGVRRRAMLGQALVSDPDLLLLDEPTNHLDIDAINALEEALLGFKGAVVFITHDRTFIDRLATRIIELDRGVLRSFPGSYSEYLKRKNAILETEADLNRKFDQTLAQEETWIRQGIKARRTRNEGRVTRLEAMRKERAERLNRQGKVKMSVASSDRSGKLVIETERVEFAYDESPLIKNFSTLILRGDRIGIIGKNGSGKSTLLKLLLGELEPTSGQIRHGTRLEIAYFDQERQQLDPERSVRDNLADGSDEILIGDKPRHVISYLGDFLFVPARVASPVKTLSGGERNRLLLAKLFAKPANLIVLDEPTNDLDVETLELLEELLCDYEGTLLLVSHDRSFLDRTVTSTLILTGDGTIAEHIGGYTDWERYRLGQALSSKTTDIGRPKAGKTKRKRNASDNPAKLSQKQKRELNA
ncbi:MAG: ATP-binding cassette domain-containing protein, partial [Gammaproteobacteria bacterium]|nr:ATP-binding cassette domain-containing protein [Gammaproteobacteria bacterium]